MTTRETESPPPAILITGHFKETYGYATYRSRGSGNWLITYTIQGRGLYRQAGHEIWAEPGDIVLLQPGALHDYSVPPNGYWEFLWAHFQPRLSWLSWWQPLFSEQGSGCYKAHLRSTQTQQRVQQVFLQLHADASASEAFQPLSAPEQSRDPLQRELALNGLEEILLLAVQDTQRKGGRSMDPRVQHILDIISQDLAAQHDLATLSQLVALSPSRLSHLFKQEVGDSVGNVILSLRLNKAARLLEFSSQSVGKIAEEVGFSSLYYFSRLFRQRFGMSPRAYRARVTAPFSEGGQGCGTFIQERR